MKPRFLILPVSAAIIFALVVYRLRREERQPVTGALPGDRQLAPRFELYDQSNQLVKFERYLGRTRIVLVFFDSTAGADADPLVERLARGHHVLESAGFQVVAVGTATRYANQQAAERLGGEFPFPLLTDIDPTQPIPAPVHQTWGLYDRDSGATRSGLFLIDRDGTVAWDDAAPVAVDDPAGVVEELITGSWPAGV